MDERRDPSPNMDERNGERREQQNSASSIHDINENEKIN